MSRFDLVSFLPGAAIIEYLGPSMYVKTMKAGSRNDEAMLDAERKKAYYIIICLSRAIWTNNILKALCLLADNGVHIIRHSRVNIGNWGRILTLEFNLISTLHSKGTSLATTTSFEPFSVRIC
jgi:hypothetical protein